EDRTIYIQTQFGPIEQIGRTAYSGGVTYQLALAGEPAERIDFEGGFITLPDGGYHFHVRDHLGSTRAVVSLSGALERTLDYGPYGESLGTDWAATSAPAARKLFIGKEKLKSNDTELYDFGARRYDPALPRWTSVDPLAGKYPGISPYAYCAGNPITLIDPEGKDWYRNRTTGTYTWFDGKEEHDGYENVGENLSVLGNNGRYLNFYHEQFVGMSEDVIADITSAVINNNSALGKCLDKDSKLSDSEKVDLYSRSIASAGYDFLTDPATLNAVNILVSVTSGSELLGYGFGAIVDLQSIGHVFWSGGVNIAGKAATEFATQRGMKTLEMTWGGRFLTRLTEKYGYEKIRPYWVIASRQFAKKTSGVAHAFLREGLKGDSIWLTIEEKELKKKGIEIIVHKL
ncbi:MAG: hypothetical protein IKW89_05170, partial [Bacteroidales bacterium]|nr:hypothetical protein [Bacteroidales bacterium]